MRCFVLLFTILACVLALACSTAVGQAEQDNLAAAETMLNVDSGTEHANDGVRQARQSFGSGYYGRPYYGGYGRYGGFGSPYYGGYGGYSGFGRPYYGGYSGFGRPYYGGYSGFGRPYYGYGGFYG